MSAAELVLQTLLQRGTAAIEVPVVDVEPASTAPTVAGPEKPSFRERSETNGPLEEEDPHPNDPNEPQHESTTVGVPSHRGRHEPKSERLCVRWPTGLVINTQLPLAQRL